MVATLSLCALTLSLASSTAPLILCQVFNPSPILFIFSLIGSVGITFKLESMSASFSSPWMSLTLLFTVVRLSKASFLLRSISLISDTRPVTFFRNSTCSILVLERKSRSTSKVALPIRYLKAFMPILLPSLS